MTAADREAEQRAVAVLRDAFPDHGILGEEFGERSGTGARWIIDPIDGTKSFIRGIPFFATLIALEEDGDITTGAVYAPALDDLLYAQRGSGAFDKQGRLRVSRVDTLSRSMLVFGGPGMLRSGGYWPAYERLIDHSARQRGYGDYFGYTFVARGQAEAMIDVDLKPWDLAALKIIIEEAERPVHRFRRPANRIRRQRHRVQWPRARRDPTAHPRFLVSSPPEPEPEPDPDPEFEVIRFHLHEGAGNFSIRDQVRVRARGRRAGPRLEHLFCCAFIAAIAATTGVADRWAVETR